MTDEPTYNGVRKPPRLRWSMPGIGGGPADEFTPQAGDVELSNGVPVGQADLGIVAGDAVIAKMTDPAWLQQLIDAALQEQSRLAAWQGRAA